MPLAWFHHRRLRQGTDLQPEPSRFRFDLRFRALLGGGFSAIHSRRALESQLAQGFPFLPPGCRLVLDRASSERVLANLRQSLPSRRHQLLAELRGLAAEFYGVRGAGYAALAPPDPAALGEREVRQWRMLAVQLYCFSARRLRLRRSLRLRHRQAWRPLSEVRPCSGPRTPGERS